MNSQFPQGLPPFLQPRLRLFLSADLVNFTAFKQSATGSPSTSDDSSVPSERWFPPLMHFFRGFEAEFPSIWESVASSAEKGLGWPKGCPPQIWKASGDEILYYKDLSDHRQAYACLSAWQQTVNAMRKSLREKHQQLDLKAAAWLAGFPVSNAEVIFSMDRSGQSVNFAEGDFLLTNFLALEDFHLRRIGGSESGSRVRDFIGPSMDTGFRIAGLASPRRTAISVELALLIATAEPPSYYYPRQFDALPIHFEGTVSLKGVLGGAPYPFFWVDAQADAEVSQAEDRLLHKSPSERDAVIEYCRKFIGSRFPQLTIPFILEDTTEQFSIVPDYHLDRLAKLFGIFQNEKTKRSREANPMVGADIGMDLPAEEVQSIADLVDEDLDQPGATPDSHSGPSSSAG